MSQQRAPKQLWLDHLKASHFTACCLVLIPGIVTCSLPSKHTTLIGCRSPSWPGGCWHPHGLYYPRESLAKTENSSMGKLSLHERPDGKCWLHCSCCFGKPVVLYGDKQSCDRNVGLWVLKGEVVNLLTTASDTGTPAQMYKCSLCRLCVENMCSHKSALKLIPLKKISGLRNLTADPPVSQSHQSFLDRFSLLSFRTTNLQ